MTGKRRNGLSTDPLDRLILPVDEPAGDSDEVDEPAAADSVPRATQGARQRRETPVVSKAAERVDKVKFMGGYVDPELNERVRRLLAFALPRYRIGEVVTMAMDDFIAKMEKEHNGGQPFPPLPEGESLPPGRRVGLQDRGRR